MSWEYEPYTEPHQADDAAEPAKQYAAGDLLGQGSDIQDIPWERMDISRDEYRQRRLRDYQNYTNLLEHDPHYMQRIAATCLEPQPTPPGAYFHFTCNERIVQSSIVHFQLRNLLWAASRSSIYVVHEHCVKHWVPGGDKPTTVLDLSGGTKGVHEQQPTGVGRVQISTMCVRDGIVAAGGFHGELVVKELSSGSLLYSGVISRKDNGITNGIQLFDSQRLGHIIITSNNDNIVRVFDVQTMTPKNRIAFPWAVNYTALQPTSGTLAAVVGDDKVALLTDMGSGRVVARLLGHEDYSFAAAWHPNGHLLATGNQDSSTIVWDVRRPGQQVCRLQGCMSAIRSLRFSPDGAHLVAAEPADFVHVYDVRSGFNNCQEIDLFGEIAGVSFTPSADALFIAIADTNYGSLLQFDRTLTASGTDWQAAAKSLKGKEVNRR